MIRLQQDERAFWQAVYVETQSVDGADAAVELYRKRVAANSTSERLGRRPRRTSVPGLTHRDLVGWAVNVGGLERDVAMSMSSGEILGAMADLIPLTMTSPPSKVSCYGGRWMPSADGSDEWIKWVEGAAWAETAPRVRIVPAQPAAIEVVAGDVYEYDIAALYRDLFGRER